MPAYDPDSTIFQSVSIRVNEAVGSASISPSGRDVCLASRKGLFLIDLDDPWATPRFLPYYSAIVADVQWSPHPARAHWVVSTSGHKGLVWNLAASTVAPIEHVCLGHERSITDMNWAVFQVDTLATCGMDGNVLVYDLRTGGKRPSNKYCGWRHGATQVKYNRQNPNELASSHGDCVYIWDDRKGSMPVTVIQAHKQKIYGIDYSRKRKDSIVTCSLDSTVKVRQGLRSCKEKGLRLLLVLDIGWLSSDRQATRNPSDSISSMASPTYTIWRRSGHIASAIRICSQDLGNRSRAEGGLQADCACRRCQRVPLAKQRR